jgi:hypothetical protein
MSVPDKAIPSRPECIQRLLIPIEKVTCWPKPEVPNNMDMTIGKLRSSDAEENQIVAFLQTLTDGFTTPYPISMLIQVNARPVGRPKPKAMSR